MQTPEEAIGDAAAAGAVGAAGRDLTLGGIVAGVKVAGDPVVAQHFCQFDAIATLAPGRFVSSIAAQLAAALPAYRAAIEAEAAAGHSALGLPLLLAPTP
jgi:hypothetical protein